jgi:hypothetical protein
MTQSAPTVVRRVAARLALALSALCALLPASAEAAAGLGGSRASMVRQHDAAIAHDFAFASTAEQVRRLADSGEVVRLTDTEELALVGVSYPYALPVVRALLARLAEDYREAIGSRLVVTSLVRPTSLQPANASALSVHPAGMAIDFRVPTKASARRWLEGTLLSLEREGVLDVTRERRPPHFHVAVFPDAARVYLARRDSADAAAVLVALSEMVTPAPTVQRAPATEDDRGSAAALLAFGGVLAVGGVGAGLARRRSISA